MGNDAPGGLQNPYHPFEETDRYRAFQEGWEARCDGRLRMANPYALSRIEQSLAWLDGWTAARERDRNPDPEAWRMVAERRSVEVADRSVLES